MNQSATRYREIFFELFEGLPRQGPGNRACAIKAFGLCGELPPCPAILDLGCGVGGQTLQLAEFTPGAILAIDSHAPSVARLQTVIAEAGLGPRVRAIIGDMAHPGLPLGSLDLVWSEGALYTIGLGKALGICHDLLRPGGYLAFTEAVWRKANPPPEVRSAFEDYPAMGRLDDALAAIGANGLAPVGHFTLPDEAWWTDFYAPMERRIAELRSAYFDDAEALTILDALGEEPKMHRRYSDFYAYEFFVARRPLVQMRPEAIGAIEPSAAADRPAPAAVL